MRLNEYIEDNQVKVAEFAVAIGVTRDCVYKYMSGKRKPTDEIILQNIKVETQGKVTANDFYALPKKRDRK